MPLLCVTNRFLWQRGFVICIRPVLIYKSSVYVCGEDGGLYLYVVQGGLEFTILLPLSPKCCVYRRVPHAWLWRQLNSKFYDKKWLARLCELQPWHKLWGCRAKDARWFSLQFLGVASLLENVLPLMDPVILRKLAKLSFENHKLSGIYSHALTE